MISMPAFIAAMASLLLAGAIALLLTPMVRRWATNRDFVDHPAAAAHKTHGRIVPFGGGIAITVAVLLPMVAILVMAWAYPRLAPILPEGIVRWAPHWADWMGGVTDKIPAALAVIAGAMILHVLGLIDDHWPLSAGIKLLVQIAVALLLTAGFEIRAAEALGPGFAVAVTTLWIVALTNAFNFIDNMDGLSAGLALLTGLMLAACALQVGQVFVPCLALLVAGAAGGFLVYNFHPAQIFMGDAGSLVIGYLLAVASVLTTYYDPGQQQTPFGVLVPLVIFAVPLYDMASVMFHRYRQGVSVFRGDRGHFSHRLVGLGMSTRAAVLTIYLATLATSLPALLLPHLGWMGAGLIMGQCACVVALIAVLESHRGR